MGEFPDIDITNCPVAKEFIMKICLYGCQNGEQIVIEPVKVLGYPDSTSYEGGYDLICKLTIDVGCYHIYFDRLFSATGALFKFVDQLQSCYDRLDGEAEYGLILERNLSFTVKMKKNGHAIVTGVFQERQDIGNRLEFVMETDQTCLLPVMQEINSLRETYGGMQGVR